MRQKYESNLGFVKRLFPSTKMRFFMVVLLIVVIAIVLKFEPPKKLSLGN